MVIAVRIEIGNPPVSYYEELTGAELKFWRGGPVTLWGSPGRLTRAPIGKVSGGVLCMVRPGTSSNFGEGGCS